MIETTPARNYSGKIKKQGKKKRTKPTCEPQIQLLVDGGCVSLQSFAACPSFGSVGARQSSVVATAFPRGASWGGASSQQLQFFSLLGLSVSSTSRPEAAGIGASLPLFTRTPLPGMVEAEGMGVALKACCGLLCWNRG